MTHRHHDVFNLSMDTLELVLPLAFRTGFDGEVESLVVRLEQAVAPIEFQRRPDAEALDPQLRQMFAGRYAMGPFELVVEVHGDQLVADAGAAGRFELEPYRGMTFTVRNRPGITVEFVSDGESVERIYIDPLGTFVPEGGGETDGGSR